MSDDTNEAWQDMQSGNRRPILPVLAIADTRLVAVEKIAESKRIRIALVESDDLIRTLIKRWLEEKGHTVKWLAVEDLKRGNGIDLIIADVPRPRDATLLIGSVQAAHAAPLLLISGRFRRGQGASVALAGQVGVSAVLPKPFTRIELLTAVARAMAMR